MGVNNELHAPTPLSQGKNIMYPISGAQKEYLASAEILTRESLVIQLLTMSLYQLNYPRSSNLKL